MKILQVNKFGRRGTGADNYFLDLTERLAAAAEVAVLCTDPCDVPAGTAVFKASAIDFHAATGVTARASAARRVLWSDETAVLMREALNDFEPDVVHYHNYSHQLSNAVLAVALEAGVRTVATAHDYKLICPAYIARRGGESCFRCASARPVHCITGRCLHGSLSWSVLATVEAMATRRGRLIPDEVIAPSRFMGEQLERSWLADHPSATVTVLPNPVGLPPPGSTRQPQGHGVFVGRLSEEKGIDVAIRASARAGVPLRVIGSGPAEEDLRALASKLQAEIAFVGFRQGHELEREWESASFLVQPSVWPENAPLTVLEAMIRGVPVIAADIGGMPEQIRTHSGGRLVPSGDVDSLAHAMSAGARGAVDAADPADVARQAGWASHLAGIRTIYGGTTQ